MRNSPIAYFFVILTILSFISCKRDPIAVDRLAASRLKDPISATISIEASAGLLHNISTNLAAGEYSRKRAGSSLVGRAGGGSKVGRVEITDRVQWPNPSEVGLTVKGFADEFTMTPEWLGRMDVFHLGSIIRGNTANDLSFIPLSERLGEYEAKPVSVSVSFPAKTVTGSFLPDVMASSEFFSTLMKNNKIATLQNSAFQYEIEEFTYYNEIKTVFGTDVNVKALFFKTGSSGTTSSDKISKKTGLVASFTQKNFSVDMNFPEEGEELYDKLNVADLANVAPVYINSVMYGAKGVLLIESTEESDVVKSTFEKAFSVMGGLVDGSKKLSTEELATIAGSEIQILFVGASGSIVKKLGSLDELIGIIKNGITFSASTPGVPISFKMRTLLGNKAFQNKFNFEIKIKPFYAKNEYITENGTTNRYATFFADKYCRFPIIIPENIPIHPHRGQMVWVGNPKEGGRDILKIDYPSIYNKDKSPRVFLQKDAKPKQVTGAYLGNYKGIILVDSREGWYNVVD